jgi:branched-subunit amino acid transport protein
MNLWLTILIAGGVTFATRLSFIYLLEKVHMPEWFRRTLRFVPAAVLSAIVLPALIIHDGALNITWKNPQLLSGIIAVAVAWKTKNVLITIAAGMISLLLLQALFAAV